MPTASYALQQNMSSQTPSPKKTLLTDYPPDLVKYKRRADIDRQEEHYTPIPFLYHHTSSARLVRAAANSSRLTKKVPVRNPTKRVPPRKPVPTRSETEDQLGVTDYTTLDTDNCLRPALIECKTYTSRPQVRKPASDHRFSQFLGDDLIKKDEEGEDKEARRSSLHPFEAVAKKT
jgi:hypothetical protein